MASCEPNLVTGIPTVILAVIGLLVMFALAVGLVGVWIWAAFQ